MSSKTGGRWTNKMDHCRQSHLLALRIGCAVQLRAFCIFQQRPQPVAVSFAQLLHVQLWQMVHRGQRRRWGRRSRGAHRAAPRTDGCGCCCRSGARTCLQSSFQSRRRTSAPLRSSLALRRLPAFSRRSSAAVSRGASAVAISWATVGGGARPFGSGGGGGVVSSTSSSGTGGLPLSEDDVGATC